MEALLAMLGSKNATKALIAARLLAIHLKMVAEAEARLLAAAKELEARHERDETITIEELQAAGERMLARDAAIEQAVADAEAAAGEPGAQD